MSENEVKYEVLPAKDRAEMLSREDSIFFNVAKFEQAQRIAQMFASSTMVPEMFRNNIGNCMIGLNYAARIGADPFMVLQTMYIVHGRPGVEAKLIEAVINQSAKYSEPLQYEWLGEDDELTTRQVVLKGMKDDQGCQAFTIDRKSSKRVIGPKITWALVKAEGWYDKPGPDKTIKTNKWRTMPEMMFYYRAASWFANKNCPELKLGMMTKEEIEDSIIDVTPTKPTLPSMASAGEEKPGVKAYDFKQAETENASTSGPPEGIPLNKEPEPKTDPPTADPKTEAAKAILAQIKSARPNASETAKKAFASLYSNNRDIILSLKGTDFDYAQGKFVNAGFSWGDDFLGANQAQAATSPQGQANGPGQGEKTPTPPLFVIEGEEEGAKQEPSEPDPLEAIRAKIREYRDLIYPARWQAVESYYRSWESDKADVDTLNKMLEQCKTTLDRQNTK